MCVRERGGEKHLSKERGDQCRRERKREKKGGFRRKPSFFFLLPSFLLFGAGPVENGEKERQKTQVGP